MRQEIFLLIVWALLVISNIMVFLLARRSASQLDKEIPYFSFVKWLPLITLILPFTAFVIQNLITGFFYIPIYTSFVFLVPCSTSLLIVTIFDTLFIWMKQNSIKSVMTPTTKKILALFICLLIIDDILFVAYVQNLQNQNERMFRRITTTMGASITTDLARQSATPTSTPSWATEAAYFHQTATADPRQPISWSLEIIQNEQPVSEQNGIYTLKKAPFTFRIIVPQSAFNLPGFAMLINTWNRPDNYEKIKPGMIDAPYCFQKPEVEDCMVFSGSAEGHHSDQVLLIDYERGVKSNFIYFKSPDDTRWDRIDIRDQEVSLERDVLNIALSSKENEFNVSPIKTFPENKLYLLFVLKYRAGNTITEDELKKAIVVFE